MSAWDAGPGNGQKSVRRLRDRYGDGPMRTSARTLLQVVVLMDERPHEKQERYCRRAKKCKLIRFKVGTVISLLVPYPRD
jgi:hypothetical protein